MANKSKAEAAGPIRIGKGSRELYATEEKTFQLAEFEVPPRRYDQFLMKVSERVKELILEHHKCKSLEEIAEKQRRSLRRLNPEKKEEELAEFLDSPLFVMYDGRLEFRKQNKNPVNRVCRSGKYEEALFEKFNQRLFYAYGKDIPKYITAIRKALDKRYPKRRGNLPEVSMNKAGGAKSIYNHICSFEFTYKLMSLPLRHLEIEITLQDYGSISKGKGWISIPGIKLKAEALEGPSAFPKRIVESLAEIVSDFYDISAVERKSSIYRMLN